MSQHTTPGKKPIKDDCQTHTHNSEAPTHKSTVDTEHCFYKGGPMSHELLSHLPFSVLSVTVGLMIAGLICFLTSDATLDAATEMLSHVDCDQDHDHDHGAHDDHSSTPVGFLFLFHLFHPAHILFSAIATTAMFYKYDKSLVKAIFIGATGSILICTVSDAVIPYMTVKIMGFDSPIHLCIVQTPMQVIPFALAGVFLGLAIVLYSNIHSTITSHSIHVATSTMATLFYTVAYSDKLLWINQIGTVFLMTIVAVGGICCLSDVVFPLLFTKKARKDYALHGHHHPH